MDDIILTSNNDSFVPTLITTLNVHFKMKDLGSLSFFLGITIAHDKGGLSLSQSKYILKRLDRTDMSGCKPVSSSAAIQKISKDEGCALSDPTQYRSIVGALQYVTLTRPDITFAVNQVCQFLQVPTDVHMTVVKRIIRYLKGTISYECGFSPSTLQLRAFCDADWAGCPSDRRSTHGFYVFLGANPISWCSRKQTVVARSSTEAEYMSLANTATKLCWVQSLIKELGCENFSTPVI